MDIYGSKYVYNTNKQLLSNAGMIDKWLGIIYLQNCCLELYFQPAKQYLLNLFQIL